MLIYKWTNKINGKIYIGQTTKSLADRVRMHVNTASAGSTVPLHNAIRKYGIESFIIEVVEKAVSLEELNRLEIKYILEYNCLAPRGYNLKAGGDNHHWHPNSREKARKSAKARMTKDNGAQWSQVLAKGRESLKGKDPWNKGKKATSEAILNQSKAHIGQPAWNKTALYCVETGELFSSIKEAAIKLNLQSSKICNVLKGKRKHTGGLTFKYEVA